MASIFRTTANAARHKPTSQNISRKNKFAADDVFNPDLHDDADASASHKAGLRPPTRLQRAGPLWLGHRYRGCRPCASLARDRQERGMGRDGRMGLQVEQKDCGF
jgi:hypothetical protein